MLVASKKRKAGGTSQSGSAVRNTLVSEIYLNFSGKLPFFLRRRPLPTIVPLPVAATNDTAFSAHSKRLVSKCLF